MNISRYPNIDKFVNIRYIFLLARRAYSWLFQLAQMWKLLAPGVGLVDFLTPVLVHVHEYNYELVSDYQFGIFKHFFPYNAAHLMFNNNQDVNFNNINSEAYF